MRVLVTGATGFVGSALVETLRARGDEVVRVSRRDGPDAVGWTAIEREVARADAIVHLAGEPVADRPWTDERLERIRASRVESTERIARAIEQSSRRPRVLVSGSAIGLYGMRQDDDLLDESAPPGSDVLAKIVVAWEVAADPARSAGVRVVHPRLGVVLGKGGGALAKMVTPFRWFVGGPLGTGTQWVSWVHLHDVVRAILFVIATEDISGPVNVVAPTPVTMEELARSIATATRRPSAFRVPAFALKVALGEGRAEMLLTGQRVVPRRLEEAGFAFDFPRVAEACADLLRSQSATPPGNTRKSG